MKRSPFLYRQYVLVRCAFGKSVIAVEFGVGTVVAMNVLARRDVLTRETYDLSELENRLTALDLGNRHLVALENARGGLDVVSACSRHQPVDGNDNVVVGVKA